MMLTKQVRQLVDVLDGHRAAAQLGVDLFAHLAHCLGVLEQEVEREREHA